MATRGTPILSVSDLAEFAYADSFATKIEAAKRASTLAVERCVERGLTQKSCQSAALLLKFGETVAEKSRGLELVVRHLSSPDARVVNTAIEIIKRSTRRANLNAAAIGTALSDARRARVAEAKVG